jgi:hypothetical protein
MSVPLIGCLRLQATADAPQPEVFHHHGPEILFSVKQRKTMSGKYSNKNCKKGR